MKSGIGISKASIGNIRAQGLRDEIATLLSENGIRVRQCDFAPMTLLECCGPGGHRILILPIEIICIDEEQAAIQAQAVSSLKSDCQRHFKLQGLECPGIIAVPADRWKSQKEMMLKRLLAHCGLFASVFARNCEVRRIDKSEAHSFMKDNHSYGPASCRYCYGLFIKRSSGISISDYPPGTLVAAAEFSNARKWIKSGKAIRSYEWIRYASLPGLRVTGGMGKILRFFIDEVHPDDIMSYADTEWSVGEVYTKLGFEEAGSKAPVLFRIDPVTWEREAVKSVAEQGTDTMYYMNSGSVKYRLRLTQWEDD